MSVHPIAAVIMAAGKGKRMLNPNMSKVMYSLAGIPMIDHVVACTKQFGAQRIIVIVGHQREALMEHLRKNDSSIEFAVQAEQLGTGHAIMQTEALLANFIGDIVVLSGDVPLLRAATVEQLLRHHRESHAVVTVLTTMLPDPSGYGRIVRAGNGSITRIVEHKDASEHELRIQEINSGIYVFQSKPLFQGLQKITNTNAQGEYYLTDVFEIFSREGLRMEPFVVDSFDEIRGVNTKEQLEELEKIYFQRYNEPTYAGTNLQ